MSEARVHPKARPTFVDLAELPEVERRKRLAVELAFIFICPDDAEPSPHKPGEVVT